jgi:hypothetical protein
MRFNWGWRIALVYTLFALGTLSFVGFALTKEVDLVRSDYYEQGLQHDAHARALARTQELQPNVTADVRGKVLHCSMPTTMVGATVEIEMYCPSQTRQDKRFSVTVGQAGSFTIPLQGYINAPWKMTAVWMHGGQSYRFEHQFTVRG